MADENKILIQIEDISAAPASAPPVAPPVPMPMAPENAAGPVTSADAQGLSRRDRYEGAGAEQLYHVSAQPQIVAPPETDTSITLNHPAGPPQAPMSPLAQSGPAGLPDVIRVVAALPLPVIVTGQPNQPNNAPPGFPDVVRVVAALPLPVVMAPSLAKDDVNALPEVVRVVAALPLPVVLSDAQLAKIGQGQPPPSPTPKNKDAADNLRLLRDILGRNAGPVGAALGGSQSGVGMTAVGSLYGEASNALISNAMSGKGSAVAGGVAVVAEAVLTMIREFNLQQARQRRLEGAVGAAILHHDEQSIALATVSKTIADKSFGIPALGPVFASKEEIKLAELQKFGMRRTAEEQRANQLARFSPQISAAMSMAEAKVMLANVEEAQDFSQEFANMIEQRTNTELMSRHARRDQQRQDMNQQAQVDHNRQLMFALAELFKQQGLDNARQVILSELANGNLEKIKNLDAKSLATLEDIRKQIIKDMEKTPDIYLKEMEHMFDQANVHADRDDMKDLGKAWAQQPMNQPAF